MTTTQHNRITYAISAGAVGLWVILWLFWGAR